MVKKLVELGARIPRVGDCSLTLSMMDFLIQSSDKFYHSFCTTPRDFSPALFEKSARAMMHSGMTTLLAVIFGQLPRQNASDEVFAQILHTAAVAGDSTSVRLLVD